jgi:hypothetical protein
VKHEFITSLLNGIGIGGRIASKCIKEVRVCGCGLDSSGSDQGPVAGCFRHGNEPPESINRGEFIGGATTNF